MFSANELKLFIFNSRNKTITPCNTLDLFKQGLRQYLLSGRFEEHSTFHFCNDPLRAQPEEECELSPNKDLSLIIKLQYFCENAAHTDHQLDHTDLTWEI